MSPVRWDPISGVPLLIATDRTRRPHDTTRGEPDDRPPSSDGPVEGCPFCPGAEDETPPEVWADRAHGVANAPGWRVRAIPNRYPVLPAHEGVHEVIINSNRHVTALWDLAGADLARAIDGWALREQAVREDPRGLWPFLFLNQGANAGASLQHSHAQVAGLPFAPPELSRRAAAFARSGVCPICAELEDPSLALITGRGPLVAWCPKVPPLSGGVRIAPRRHAARWPARPGTMLAPLLGPVFRELCAVVGTSAANLWLHSAHDGASDGFHWHIEIVPRRGTLAGLELGAGVFALLIDPVGLADAVRLRISS